jgi:hypothetical protein
MSESLLRARNGNRAEVNSVELFFDLVFVITVTQISHALLANMTWLGALEARLMAVATWWAWIDTARRRGMIRSPGELGHQTGMIRMLQARREHDTWERLSERVSTMSPPQGESSRQVWERRISLL